MVVGKVSSLYSQGLTCTIGRPSCSSWSEVWIRARASASCHTSLRTKCRVRPFLPFLSMAVLETAHPTPPGYLEVGQGIFYEYRTVKASGDYTCLLTWFWGSYTCFARRLCAAMATQVQSASAEHRHSQVTVTGNYMSSSMKISDSHSFVFTPLGLLSSLFYFTLKTG